MNPLDLVAKLTQEQHDAVGSDFLAPYVPGAQVCLKISNLPHLFKVRSAGKNTEGFFIFRIETVSKIMSHAARIIRPAEPELVSKYMQLLPRLRLVLVDRFPIAEGTEPVWHALPADTTGGQGPIPVRLVQRAGRLDTVYARFDGQNAWYDGYDRRRPPNIAADLRGALQNNQEIDEVHVLGSVPSEKLAYKMLWAYNNASAALRSKDPIQAALDHGGASLQKHWNSGKDQSTVQFELNGKQHTVTVQTSTLQVVSSGICLAGRDKDFDLSSLLSVFEEARRNKYDWHDDPRRARR